MNFFYLFIRVNTDINLKVKILYMNLFKFPRIIIE